MRLEEEADRHAYITIAFTAFALESFINAFAYDRLSEEYFNTHINRKLNLLAKFIEVPKLVSGRPTPEGELLRRLRDLIDARNRLAHPKTVTLYRVDEEELQEKLTDPQADADNAIALLDYMAQAAPELAAGEVSTATDFDDGSRPTM